MKLRELTDHSVSNKVGTAATIVLVINLLGGIALIAFGVLEGVVIEYIACGVALIFLGLASYYIIKGFEKIVTAAEYVHTKYRLDESEYEEEEDKSDRVLESI